MSPIKRSGTSGISRTKFVGLAAAVVALAFAATVLFRILPIGDQSGTAAAAIAPEPALLTPAPKVVPLPSDAPIPTSGGMAAALAGPVANPDLGTFTGSVADAKTGAVLWSSDPNTPMTPASTTKILTAAAAMIGLPTDHRVATRVVAGSAPGELVLVGGGDPTLTAQPVGSDGFFAGGARIADLADQVRGSGVPVTTIAVDNGLYSGDELAEGWFTADIAGGDIAPIETVMLDSGRIVPQQDESPRSATPSLDAGRALAAALGLDPSAVSAGSAAQGANQVAIVQSAPLRVRLGQMLEYSDNVLGEAIGRELALDMGKPASFGGAIDAVTSTLTGAGFDMTGVQLSDTSGLSEDGLIPARVLGAIVTAAAGDSGDGDSGDGALNSELRPMLAYLPVAGATGTLADRYASGNRTAAGWLRAKTGTLSTASALAGYVVDQSGRVLTFALISNDRPPNLGRPALDSVAAALRSCGCT